MASNNSGRRAPRKKKSFSDTLEKKVDDLGGVAPFARAVGVTNQTVYNWLQGASSPAVQHLTALSRELGLTMEEIVSGG